MFSVHNNLKTLISQPEKVSQRIVPSNRFSCLKVEFLRQKHLPTSHKHFLGSEDSSKQLPLRFLNLGSNKTFILWIQKILWWVFLPTMLRKSVTDCLHYVRVLRSRFHRKLAKHSSKSNFSNEKVLKFPSKWWKSMKFHENCCKNAQIALKHPENEVLPPKIRSKTVMHPKTS